MNPADLDAETFAADEYNKKFKRINIIFKSKSNNREESDNSSSVQSISKRKFKLPLLELKKFGGEIKDWLPFWGQFSKIDSDPNIDEADKLQYLIQATLPSTRARELVESFPPSKENYHKAIDSLKSRFGQDDLLVEFYVRELLKLTISMNSRDQKVKLPTLYDRIETQLRALESLGVTTEKYAAMLFPLVESCLSEEVLRAWQRNNSFNDKKEESRLENLMQFLKNEVEGEERINLAMKGFSVKDNPKIYSLKKPMHTAAGLFAGSQSSSNCAFCNEKNHESKNCKLALNLDLQEKTTLLAKKKCCYRCFKTGHMVRQCTNKIKCSQCQRRHYNVMCPELKPVVSTGSVKLVDKAVENSNEKFNTLANPTCSADVLLQTLVVYLYGNDGSFPVRALIDTGSQKSYITKEAVSKMSYEPIRAEDMIHNLFGGVESKQKHHLYKVYASSFQKDYHCSFEAYDQEKICIDIPTAISGPWTKEIEKKGIFLSDKEACLDYSASSVHLLIGADIAGATLNHLLDGAPDCYKMTAQHLQKSMYVDNCVASVKSEADLTKFINESREIMALGKFELRGWQHNSFESLRDNCNESQNASPILQDIPVLGLLWNIERDTLKIDVRNDTQSESVKVTKRYILSKCHKIFDPIGITAPITLIPKILLQETWKIKANWDDILPEEIAHKFEKWDRQLHQLNKLEIPRWIQGHKNSKHSLHIGAIGLLHRLEACQNYLH
ncbi:hypothetical protein CDAR_70932 [Caerostris darwini]|uniref:CCHC-type domain-containing protein n=1 Tax=Caerostris darwini TaxID=1538125 RepID=A0AAV4WGM4_9ARAC|nr:hypothetical protein CDAR_70932 [Caerostris darwini]